MPPIDSVLAVIFAYLIGSLSFAVIVSRAMGLKDPRRYGSCNPGATNVLRSGSKPAAILTLVLDALKGFVPVLLVKLYGAANGLHEGTIALVGLAAFMGHLWPVFFRFKGGKGVATAAGVLFAVNPWSGAFTLATFLIIVAVTRYVSVASIVSAVFAPFCQWLLLGAGYIAAAVTLMSALLIWRHAGNIRKLIKGNENRWGQRSAESANPHSSNLEEGQQAERPQHALQQPPTSGVNS